MTAISSHIRQRYPGSGCQEALFKKLSSTCQAFVDSGLADPKFISELTSGLDAKFWSHASEALLAERLRDKTFPRRAKPGKGPDILVMDGNRKAWIEVICPEPVRVPESWLNLEARKVGDFPHEEILLRWTSAIKTKAEMLIGTADGKKAGYIKKGLVGADDAYVIAVNGCRLRNGPFSALIGISQFPFAVEAVFPIGPYQLRVDQTTLEVVGGGHQVRVNIKNHNQAPIPTSIFLDPRFSRVSAIWAVDLDGASVIGNREPTAVIHNPLATLRLSVGFLAADEEYVAETTGDNEYVLRRISSAKANDG